MHILRLLNIHKLKLLVIISMLVFSLCAISRYNLSETESKSGKIPDMNTAFNKMFPKDVAHGISVSGIRNDYAMHTSNEDLGKEIAFLRNKVSNLESEIARLGTYNEPKIYPKVKQLNFHEKKRFLVTGGAGFVGSHLVDVLMTQGHEVTAVDNFFTGSKFNVERWIGHKNFEIIRHDIVNPLYIEVDYIYHLASPASPPHYMENPVKTIKTNTLGTINMLGLARRVDARLLVASTSEVYGDPEVHPQSESYWGHVNPIGPRSCYDEGKRIAEALCYAYEKQDGVEVRVARIFNTYGPRMHLNDGRVVSNFILQAIQNKPMTIYGSGKQTRSFQYVSDLVEGLIALMHSNYSQPVNLGNPEEYSIQDFANVIHDLVGGASQIIHTEQVIDDPQRRRPDITIAKKVLGWKPKISLQEGLQKTVQYFRRTLIQEGVDAGSLTPPINYRYHP